MTSPTPPTTAQLRARMVSEQIEGRGIREERLLAVLRDLPRHLFVAEEYRAAAYDDGPLPTRFNQTISQPYIVALMTFLLRLGGSERVLEIGTGSGYQSAILGRLAGEVHTIEYHPALAENARDLLNALGIENVHFHVGDGSLGLPAHAPYQAILVTAAAPRPPAPLLDQLDSGGRMVVPVGAQGGQQLQVWRKMDGQLTGDDIAPVAFVPLRGAFGWSYEQWSDTHEPEK